MNRVDLIKLGGNGLSARRGFTLIEILLAVAIFSVVLAAMNLVFASALRLHTSSSRILNELAPLNQTWSILRSDLQGAAAPNGPLSGTFQAQASSSFTASGNSSGSLQFHSTSGALSEGEPWGEMQRITYQLRPSTTGRHKGQELIRVVNRNLLANDQDEVFEQPLLQGVDSLQFSFSDGSFWRDTWDTSTSETNLPRAVRVSIRMADPRPEVIHSDREPLELVVLLSAESRSTNQVQSVSEGSF